MGKRLFRAPDVGAQHGVITGRLEGFAQVHADCEALVDDENPVFHTVLPATEPASTPSLVAI